jgi:hypothetical protein
MSTISAEIGVGSVFGRAKAKIADATKAAGRTTKKTARIVGRKTKATAVAAGRKAKIVGRKALSLARRTAKVAGRVIARSAQFALSLVIGALSLVGAITVMIVFAASAVAMMVIWLLGKVISVVAFLYNVAYDYAHPFFSYENEEDAVVETGFIGVEDGVTTIESVITGLEDDPVVVTSTFASHSVKDDEPEVVVEDEPSSTITVLEVTKDEITVVEPEVPSIEDQIGHESTPRHSYNIDLNEFNGLDINDPREYDWSIHKDDVNVHTAYLVLAERAKAMNDRHEHSYWTARAQTRLDSSNRQLIPRFQSEPKIVEREVVARLWAKVNKREHTLRDIRQGVEDEIACLVKVVEVRIPEEIAERDKVFSRSK